MPSEKKSWFARYCTPPPPINNTSVCPCASCYNTGTNSHGSSYSSYPYSYTTTTTMTTTAPSSSESFGSRASSRVASSDGASISSADTVTTTTHIEHAKH